MTAPRRARLPKSRQLLDDQGQPAVSNPTDRPEDLPQFKYAAVDADKRIVYVEESAA